MNEAERQQAFVNEYNALAQRYGFTFGATLKPEQLGMVVQVRPELILTAIEGWKEPEGEITYGPPVPHPLERNGKHVKAPR